MSLSPMTAECVAIYEQEHGCKPSDLVIQIGEHIEKVAGILATQGAQDAQKGCTARHAGFFRDLFRYAFRRKPAEDDETAEIVADLWQSFYMEGYQKGGAVDGV